MLALLFMEKILVGGIFLENQKKKVPIFNSDDNIYDN